MRQDKKKKREKNLYNGFMTLKVLLGYYYFVQLCAILHISFSIFILIYLKLTKMQLLYLTYMIKKLKYLI